MNPPEADDNSSLTSFRCGRQNGTFQNRPSKLFNGLEVYTTNKKGFATKKFKKRLIKNRQEIPITVKIHCRRYANNTYLAFGSRTAMMTAHGGHDKRFGINLF